MAELDGLDAMLSALDGLGERVEAATPGGLTKAAHHVEAMVKLELSRTSHPRGTPTPSPPGSPPSLISGALRRSIQVEGPRPTGGGRWTAQIGPTIIYGRIQELGGGHLPARPYMRPGLIQALPGIQSFMQDAWADALS